MEARFILYYEDWELSDKSVHAVYTRKTNADRAAEQKNEDEDHRRDQASDLLDVIYEYQVVSTYLHEDEE
jgi:hypothetical protein